MAKAAKSSKSGKASSTKATKPKVKAVKSPPKAVKVAPRKAAVVKAAGSKGKVAPKTTKAAPKAKATPKVAKPKAASKPAAKKVAPATKAKRPASTRPASRKTAAANREGRDDAGHVAASAPAGRSGGISTFKPGSHGPGEGGVSSLLRGKPGSSAMPEAPAAGKARLTRTKLTPRELAHFADLLRAKRRQLHGDAEQMENEALRSDGSNLSTLPLHMADIGTDNYEQEFTLTLVDRDRRLIDEINHALVKIDAKTYGICEGTGQMINKARLEGVPWTRYSIEYARYIQRVGPRRATSADFNATGSDTDE